MDEQEPYTLITEYVQERLNVWKGCFISDTFIVKKFE